MWIDSLLTSQRHGIWPLSSNAGQAARIDFGKNKMVAAGVLSSSQTGANHLLIDRLIQLLDEKVIDFKTPKSRP